MRRDEKLEQRLRVMVEASAEGYAAHFDCGGEINYSVRHGYFRSPSGADHEESFGLAMCARCRAYDVPELDIFDGANPEEPESLNHIEYLLAQLDAARAAHRAAEERASTIPPRSTQPNMGVAS